MTSQQIVNLVLQTTLDNCVTSYTVFSAVLLTPRRQYSSVMPTRRRAVNRKRQREEDDAVMTTTAEMPCRNGSAESIENACPVCMEGTAASTVLCCKQTICTQCLKKVIADPASHACPFCRQDLWISKNLGGEIGKEIRRCREPTCTYYAFKGSGDLEYRRHSDICPHRPWINCPKPGCKFRCVYRKHMTFHQKVCDAKPPSTRESTPAEDNPAIRLPPRELLQEAIRDLGIILGGDVRDQLAAVVDELLRGRFEE